MSYLVGFKLFFEENANSIAAIEDEMGINHKDHVKAINADPQAVAHIDFGSGNNKLSAYNIKLLTNGGAVVSLKPVAGHKETNYLTGKDGTRLNTAIDSKEYVLSPKGYQDFSQRGWLPAVLAAQQSAMPGQM